MIFVERKPLRAAVQWTGGNQSEIDDFLSLTGIGGSTSVSGTVLTITIGGNGYNFNQNDWVIQGDPGGSPVMGGSTTWRDTHFNTVWP